MYRDGSRTFVKINRASMWNNPVQTSQLPDLIKTYTFHFVRKVIAHNTALDKPSCLRRLHRLCYRSRGPVYDSLPFAYQFDYPKALLELGARLNVYHGEDCRKISGSTTPGSVVGRFHHWTTQPARDRCIQLKLHHVCHASVFFSWCQDLQPFLR